MTVQYYCSSSTFTSTSGTYYIYQYVNRPYQSPAEILFIKLKRKFNGFIYFSKNKINNISIKIKKSKGAFVDKLKNKTKQIVNYANHAPILSKNYCPSLSHSILEINILIKEIKNDSYDHEKLFLIEKVYLAKIKESMQNKKIINNDFAIIKINEQLELIKSCLIEFKHNQINDFNKKIVINTDVISRQLKD